MDLWHTPRVPQSVSPDHESSLFIYFFLATFYHLIEFRCVFCKLDYLACNRILVSR